MNSRDGWVRCDYRTLIIRGRETGASRDRVWRGRENATSRVEVERESPRVPCRQVRWPRCVSSHCGGANTANRLSIALGTTSSPRHLLLSILPHHECHSRPQRGLRVVCLYPPPTPAYSLPRNDILRQKGIIPEKPPDPEPLIQEALVEAEHKAYENRLEDKDLDELDELEDEEDDEFLEQYRYCPSPTNIVYPTLTPDPGKNDSPK